jgi:hypothetical protein
MRADATSLIPTSTLAAQFTSQSFHRRDHALCKILQLFFLQRAVLCLKDSP